MFGPPMPDSFLKAIVDSLSDGVYYVNRDRTITYWNQSAERLSGFTDADMVGRYCHSNILAHVDAAGTALCWTICPLAATIQDGQPREVDVWLRHRDGHRVPVRVRTSALRDATGTIQGAVETFDDNTAKLRAVADAVAAHRDALTDALTQLPNRRYLEREVAGRRGNAQRYGRRLGFLIVDIDHFKDINDRHGHAVGDRVLQVVARTLLGGVREGDFVARWGGEEFVALIENAGDDALAVTAERLRALVSASRVMNGDEEIAVRVSIGGTVLQADEPSDALFARADELLYRAKKTGRDRLIIAA